MTNWTRLKLTPLLLLSVFQQSISDLEVYKTKTDRTVVTQPEFLTTDQYQVENVTEGHSISLKCRVINLAVHHTVSWIRLSDVQVLTVGGLVFSSDPRIEVSIQNGRRPGSGTWTLRISPVVVQDSGNYQCQVNTEPSSTFDVTVIVNPLHTDSSDLSEAFLDKENQYNALLTDFADSRNPAAANDIFAAVDSQNFPSSGISSPSWDSKQFPPEGTSSPPWETQASPAYLPHVNSHVQRQPDKHVTDVTAVYLPDRAGQTTPGTGSRAPAPGFLPELEDQYTPRSEIQSIPRSEIHSVPQSEIQSAHEEDIKNVPTLKAQPIPPDDVGPQPSSLEEARSTQLSGIDSDISDEEDGMEEESILMIPILSLFSVSAFIVILGSIRSFCLKSKPKDEDLYSRGSNRSRAGTGESQRSRGSKASRGSRSSRVSRTTVRSKEEVVYQVGDGDSSRLSDRSAKDKQQIYYEIRTPEPPSLEVVHPNTRPDKQRSESSDVGAKLLQDGAQLAGGRPAGADPSQRPQSKEKFAGINKAGVRRSRERYFASEETLYSASSIPDDESLPSESQYQVPQVHTKRKVYFNPFEDFSE